MCVALALATGLAFSHSSMGALAPLGLVLCFALAALHWGSTVGLLGCICSAIALAWFYPPMNSLEVADPQLRTSLTLMVIGGVLFSLFLPKQPIWASKQRREIR